MDSIIPLQRQYGLLTKWFCNVLDGISEEDGATHSTIRPITSGGWQDTS
jgi:hypothetical protein